jgi:hypothetical protein
MDGRSSLLTSFESMVLIFKFSRGLLTTPSNIKLLDGAIPFEQCLHFLDITP